MSLAMPFLKAVVCILGAFTGSLNSSTIYTTKITFQLNKSLIHTNESTINKAHL